MSGFPHTVSFGGASFPHAMLLPPGGKVAAYVRSGGPRSGETLPRDMIVTTLNKGLARCRSGVGDVVVVLPDHAENISSADQMSSLVAGTTIIGAGHGNLRPTFTWTAATATFLFDVANTKLYNCILNMDPGTGTTTVAAPITVSAAGCGLYNCRIRVSTDANSKTTIPVTTTAAADHFQMVRCEVYGATAGEVTTCVRLVGADNLLMEDCTFIAATSSTTVGCIQFLTTASTNVIIRRCSFRNNKAASVHAATGMAGATGIVSDCDFGILDDTTLPGFETEGDLMFFRCQTVNLAGEAGAAKTPVSA